MAKKKKEVEVKKDFDVSKYDQYMKEQEICDMVESNYMPYAMSVIISRALPDVRDGLKPSQRKVLYTMKNMNLTPGHKSKSANIAGTTLRVNPHSDQSCYETMVRMVDSNETLLSPYVAGKGSFGKHYSRDMACAASRYCVTGDTLILTQNGIMPIKDIVKNSELGKTYDIDIKIKSINGKINNAIKFFNSGNHETYTIVLKNGNKLTATPNHPILVKYPDNTIDWKLFEHLKIGDKCIIDLNNDIKFNDDYINTDYICSEVISKEFAGIQTVYSIKVDSDCHSFTANGFINHNTEASLSALGMELFKGINKNAIDMMDNYDGTMKEPTVLPVSFPAILANPTLGIAVGFASNICSFNLKELCEATIERIKHPKATLLDLMPAPDFSTGGLILYNKEEMLDIYNTGKGPIRIRSKYTIDKKNYRIEITEIPYSTTAEAIVESVIALCKTGKIKEINDIRDDTDKKGLTITIEYKRTYDPEQLMLKLFKLTPLEDTFSCNFNVIVDGNPKCLGVYSILDEWIRFRKNCVIRMLTYEKDELERKLHLLRGLEKILLNIDKAIKIIKNTEKDIDVVPNLMKAFKIDELQATYIADMKLRYINKEYILSRTAEITEVEKQIETLKKQIESDAEVKKIVITDLQAIIKKFSVERRSEIIDSSAVSSLEDGPAVSEYNVKLYITEHGYIKKLLASSINDSTEIKTKDDDKILYTFEDNNLSDLLIFTDKTNVYKTKVSDITDCKPSEFGSYLYSTLGMDETEKIIYIICTKDYKDNLLIAFENGKVALFPINVYETKTNRKMLKNGFFDGSKVIFMDTVNEETSYYIIGTDKNKKLVFTNKDVPLKTTKTTQGVQIIRLTKDTVATDCNPLKVSNKKTIEKYIPNNYPAAGR